MESFNASHNFIKGQLPDSLFGELSKLTDLDMSHNFLTGSIPPSLILLNTTTTTTQLQLQRLYLSENNLGNNQLSLPTEGWENMASLQVFDVSTNEFIGSIPSDIASMESLVELRLDKNFLTGQVPTTITQLTNLEVLSLSETLLSGLPPLTTSNMTKTLQMPKLRELQLSFNNFTELPVGLCH